MLVCVCVCVDLFNQPVLTALVGRRMTATRSEGSEATRLPMIRLRATQMQLVFMVARASAAAGGAGDSSPTEIEIEIDVEFTRPEKRAHPQSTAAGPDLLRDFVTIGHGHYEMDSLILAIYQAIATKESAQLELAFKALDLLRFHSVADDGGMTDT